MDNTRNYTKLDYVCIRLDRVLKNLLGKTGSLRPYPSENVPEADLSSLQRQEAASLMRVNHAGEVCAQALYQGQSLVARDLSLQEKMQQAASEENDHLAWCEQRLNELGSRPSYLNPLWYVGSLAIGVTAGLLGDKWSLGFLAETEDQVVTHLEKQMKLMPLEDKKSYQILEQMKLEEAQHRNVAQLAGAAELPPLIKQLMCFTSSIMVNVAYRI